jgi:DNA-directed RNA polymerase subunit RPC12/RpoP
MTGTQETERAVVCPYCGGTEFVDGVVPIDRQMLFVKTFADGRRPAGKPVVARMCEGCGNVQLVVVRKG